MQVSGSPEVVLGRSKAVRLLHIAAAPVQVELEFPVVVAVTAIMPVSCDFSQRWFASLPGLVDVCRNRGRNRCGLVALAVDLLSIYRESRRILDPQIIQSGITAAQGVIFAPRIAGRTKPTPEGRAATLLTLRHL